RRRRARTRGRTVSNGGRRPAAVRPTCSASAGTLRIRGQPPRLIAFSPDVPLRRQACAIPTSVRHEAEDAVTPETPPDINQLRERLRALGYLDARVDRYVLGSASVRAGRARFAMAAGLRVGVAAGALAGISGTIALAARAPGLIAGPRDALIVGLALVVLFTLAAAAAVSVTVLAASWYVARGRRVTPARARLAATAAGVVVALAAAAYLALWWSAAQTLFTSLPLYWNAAAVAIAVVTALLLAHAVSVVILAALARAGGDAIHAGGLFSSRAFLAVFGVLLAAGAAALAATSAPDPNRTSPALT